MLSGKDSGRAVQSDIGGRAWLVVVLAACTQAINQIDKAVVGLAAEPIMDELSLSTTQYGLVAGSLYTLFALGGIAIGFFAAPRFRPRSILIVLLLFWSLSQLPIVLAASLTTLVACRVILGAAEGGGTATALNVCHEWFPDNRRALPGALLIIGGTVGTMLAAPTLTYIISFYGWRYAFLACSVLGFVVMVGWLAFRHDGPHSARHAAGPGEGASASASVLRRLLFDKTIVGNMVVGLCAYWIVGFMVAWLAPYVRDQAGFSLISSGWILSLVYLGQSVIVLAIAALSQRLLTAGYSSRIARGHIMAACMLGGGVCFVGMAFITDPILRLILITLGTSLPGSVFSLSAAMISEVAPSAERYRVMTIILAVTTMSALLSPAIAGSMIELGTANGWRPALLLIAGVGFLGGLLGLRLLHPAATIAAFQPPRS